MRHVVLATTASGLFAAVQPAVVDAPVADAPQRSPAHATTAPEPPAARPAAAPAAWTPRVGAAREYARGRSGSVSFAVRTEEAAWGFRRHRTAPSASVVKAMLMVAYLTEPDVRRRALEPADRALLDPMIRWSSNDAATAVRNRVGDAGLQRVARSAGMRRFVPRPAWGLSEITAADQAGFFLRIDELVPARHRTVALRLLRTIVPEQRWGMAKAAPEGWRLHFKGGWGAGTGAVNHQVGLLRRGDARVAVAVLTTGSPTHAYGQETLRGVTLRLVRGLEGELVGRTRFVVARP